MVGEEIERLRAESSRGDYPSMARLARALYVGGLGQREVLRRCYGVEFPEEFFVVAEADPARLDLHVDFTTQPWELAVTPDRGGPASMPGWVIEQEIFARDPDLVPLAHLFAFDNYLHAGGAAHGGAIVCYRLRELQAGRTTVVGIDKSVDPDAQVMHCGDSLLTVMHEHQADVHRLLRLQSHHPSNLGAGSVDDEDVDEARAQLELIEDLQRKLTSRTG